MQSKLTCVVLVGGLGTRLSAVVKDIPKPMASVNGRPFLEYLLVQVRQAGFTDLVLCAGYKAEVIERYFGSGQDYGLKICYSREQEHLGTAGALALARPLIRSDPFVVMNGDSYCNVDFRKLIEQHRERHALATIVTTCVEDSARYGSVLLGADDVIIGFHEKRDTGGAEYFNGGIYLLNQKVLDFIPFGKCCPIEREIFPTLVGHGLYAFKTSGLFIDIGTPSSLHQAQALLEGLVDKLRSQVRKEKTTHDG